MLSFYFIFYLKRRLYGSTEYIGASLFILLMTIKATRAALNMWTNVFRIVRYLPYWLIYFSYHFTSLSVSGPNLSLCRSENLKTKSCCVCFRVSFGCSTCYQIMNSLNCRAEFLGRTPSYFMVSISTYRTWSQYHCWEKVCADLSLSLSISLRSWQRLPSCSLSLWKTWQRCQGLSLYHILIVNWFAVLTLTAQKLNRKMQLIMQYFQHTFSYKMKGFSVHGLIRLLVHGTHHKVFITQVQHFLYWV